MASRLGNLSYAFRRISKSPGVAIAAILSIGLGIAATQKQIDFTGMCIARIENGKIVEVWNNFDFMDLYRQVGMLPMF